MRWLIGFTIAVSGCSDRKAAPPVPAPAPQAVLQPTDDPWSRIEALATPAVSSAPPSAAERLQEAFAIAEKHADAWRELQHASERLALDRFPQGAEAIAAWTAWAREGGGLPPPGNPLTTANVTPLRMRALGKLAIESATDAASDGLHTASYAGLRLLREGRSLLDVMAAVSMLQDVQRKRRSLQAPVEDFGVRVWSELVRVIAAEAVHSRRLLAYVTTPSGRKQALDQVGSASADVKAIVEAVSSKPVEEIVPDRAASDALRAFWVAALAGADLGEPAATTIERVHKAAAAAPANIRVEVDTIDRMIERLAMNLTDLSAP